MSQQDQVRRMAVDLIQGTGVCPRCGPVREAWDLNRQPGRRLYWAVAR